MRCKDSKQHHVMFHELYSVSLLLCIAQNVRFEIPYKVLYRVRTGDGNPGKSWNFILAFSRTGKSWKINAGPGKSWKSINSCNNFSFKNSFLRDYCWISIS